MGRYDPVNNDLEKKRQEKIESFRLQFDADSDDDITEESGSPEENPQDFSIDLQSESSPEEQDIFSGDDFSDSELSSYSDDAPPPEVTLNKKELRAAKRHDKKRRRIKAKKNRVIFRTVWFAMIIFVSIMIAQYIMVGVNDMLAVGREEERTVKVTVPADATIDQIADILVSNNIIKNEAFFKLFATFTKSTTGFTQGTFQIPTNKDYMALINDLQSEENRTDTVKIQFREGISILEMAQMLEDNKVCNAQDFLNKCNSDEFDEDYEFLRNIKNKSSRYYKLEGYLFPDTYEYYVGEDPVSVIYKFLRNYNSKVYYTKIRFVSGEKKQTIAQRAQQLGMTVEDALTMASLIQAEAADEDDMYMISSILHNRLATAENGGMNENDEGGFLKLQLDSTVFYPYKTQAQVPASIRGTYSSRYNTYKIEGLPAGPICDPGMKALEAALNPPETEYYYFCHKAATADEPAKAYYAVTMEEHLANQEEAGLL